jgi:transposase
VESFRQRHKRVRRGRPAKAEPSAEATRYRLVVEAEARAQAEEEPGWTVLATTVGPAVCADVQLLCAYQEQNSTVESGLRWIKNPAAITPMWLEKPERIAALAMLTVVGLLVYGLMQRQVRLYLQGHQQHVPGNKGPTATPTAAVVLSLFTPVMMVQVQVDQAVVPRCMGGRTITAWCVTLLVSTTRGMKHTPREKYLSGGDTPLNVGLTQQLRQKSDL